MTSSDLILRVNFSTSRIYFFTNVTNPQSIRFTQDRYQYKVFESFSLKFINESVFIKPIEIFFTLHVTTELFFATLILNFMWLFSRAIKHAEEGVE